MAALLMLLAVLRIRWSSFSLVFTLRALTTAFISFHGTLMGSEPVTMVANSVYCHDQWEFMIQILTT
jgi:hypothetical protein